MFEMKQKEPSTRIHFLWARKAPVGVIFRRGPSNYVQLLKWDLNSDKLIPGQWFKGRIYERRCDLSPNGELLVYFAAKYRGPYATWTAISRPPYLTALCLWPKGDAWGGGGLFVSNTSLSLNHRADEMGPAPDFRIPKKFKVRPYGSRPGWGEDNPIFSELMVRDGWKLTSGGSFKENKFGSQIWIEFTEPEVWEKKSKSQNAGLRMSLLGIKELQGPWYVLEYTLLNGDEEIELGSCDWADINSKGEVYFAREGALYKKRGTAQESLVCDLSANRFENVLPSPRAMRW